MAASGPEEREIDYDRPTGAGPLTVKVIMLGDSAVGKSKMMERFLLDDFKPHQHSTFAVNLFRHRCTAQGRDVLVDFWDTAGQEAFKSMHPSYYHQAHACILVFDATRKVTYKGLSGWYQELRENRPKIPALCAVNKIDENPDVTSRSFNFTEKNGMPLYYVSASKGTNVVRLFTDAIDRAVTYKLDPTDEMDHILEELERD
ncbi:Rab-like protein 2A [Amphibalanus amphitrite]|uniref:Rab-like protein 2A n=1 Tax=Amphibalanus amphitrite TaxID=1232801 RepID=A0A6A4VLJ3_AMPAM|nr:Rab-like protein 2A [Amphibalanus amphitrite]